MRNILIFILFLIGLFYVRRMLRGDSGEVPRRDAPADLHDEPAAGFHSEAAVELMLPCAHCGVHVPERDGVRDASGFFCSAEHRGLGPR